MISDQLKNFFDDYAKSHQHKRNILIHKIAIPAIVFHIIAMLNWIKFYSFSFYTISLADILLVGVIVFYFSLHVTLAIYMFVFMISCLIISNITPVYLVWLIAVLAWTIQLLGHSVWEKKSPAFTKNFIQLLIGPLFFLAKMKKIY